MSEPTEGEWQAVRAQLKKRGFADIESATHREMLLRMLQEIEHLKDELESMRPKPLDISNKTDEELHALEVHPNYEYETTTGPRKNWYDADVPPEGEGWMTNVHRGAPDGWERFDYHEESYWMRKRS